MKWKDKINKQYMLISLYVIITVVIIYALSLIVKGAPQIIKEVMERLHWLIKVSKPVILGFIFAYLMDPMVDMFERRYQKLKSTRLLKRIVMPRTWAAVTSVLLLCMVILGLISLLVFTVTDQIRLVTLDDVIALAKESMASLNVFYQSVLTRLKELNIQSGELEQYVLKSTTFLVDSLAGFIEGTLTSVTNLSSYLTTFIFSIIIGIYFLIDGKMFLSYLSKICRALFSERQNEGLKRMVSDLDHVFSGYIRGQMIDAFVMMFLISIVLSITGVKFAIVIGILAGIGNLIPYFGPIVAYVSTTLVCLIGQDIRTWIISMTALFLIQAIDGNLIGPRLLSSSIKIHPLIIIISLIFGSALGGFLGMLLAVPIGAYLKLVFVRFINNRLKKKEVPNNKGAVK
ncbi:putative PurR-regulated permease PerM [Anaerotaenia torta]|uniref:AI-2E family transporter n=1 Tax=Anaerotaenia torta TaxID=433293 RepID=UPI003D1A15FC